MTRKVESRPFGGEPPYGRPGRLRWELMLATLTFLAVLMQLATALVPYLHWLLR
jgi:hypothetical protein